MLNWTSLVRLHCSTSTTAFYRAFGTKCSQSMRKGRCFLCGQSEPAKSIPHYRQMRARLSVTMKLVAEAGHQQEAVDVLLDRGRRYLYQRANITLEVDLENLAFLWNAYTKQLYSLHDPLEPPPFTPEHSFSASLRGKENLQSTPVRWRKSGKAFSESNGVLPAEFSPDYPKCKLPFEADESFNSADPEPFNPNTTFSLHKEAHSPNEACNPKIISASPEQHSGRGEEKFSQEESTREVVGVRPVAENTAAVPVAVGNTSAVSSQDCVDEESKEPSGEDRGKCSPRPEKSKIIAVSNWPDNNGKGWLRVPGEGIFTSRQRQKQRLRLSSNGDTSLSSDSDRSSNGVAEDGRSLESESPTAVNQTQAQVDDDGDQCMLPARRSSDQSADQLDGLLAGLSNDLSDLRALEEKLTMELEAAAREINGSLMDASISESRMDLSTGILDESNTSSSEAKTADESGTDNPDDLDFPTEPKRRRMNLDTPSSLSSCSGSPLISGDNSLNVTPSSSPAGTLRRDFKKHYKKDELWKSTESDLSHDEDFVPNVSFAEFLKQYQELIDWLNQAQRNTQRTVTSLSEKYLNQTYHEEMLEKSPRREFLHKYAQQLLLRYPSLRDQVNTRLQRLNNQWQAVEAAIASHHGYQNMDCMLQDLECDLAALRRWLNATESRLLPLTIRADWSDSELEERLKEHQLLQQDIESHSRIVSAVLKLSERLEHVRAACPTEADCESLQLVAINLEKRWHGIWLQSLEWQCRLEEAINRRKGLYGSTFNFSSFTLPTLDESCGVVSDLDLKADTSILSSSNGSLIELSDDSLLFIGARTEHRVAETPSPTSPLSPLTSLHLPSLRSPKLTNFLDRSSGDSANISESESKMGDSPQGVSPRGRADLSMSMSSDGEADPAALKAQQEPKDIGYSSESQSNDETELQQIALEYRYQGLCEVASDSPLGEKMAIPPTGGVRQDYYCMTHVDLDSTDKTTDDGNTTDDKMSPEHAQAANKETGDAGKSGSHEDIAVKSWLESSDEAEVGARADADMLPPAQDCAYRLTGNLSESDSSTESKEKIKYLIEHAEDLVKTSPRGTAPGSPEKRPSPSKQTQTICTETSSVESSCDASSENSEESGAEEFSTATDDADETLFDSVINLDSTANNSSEDIKSFVTSPVAVDSARLRKQTGPRSRKDRPWSVVGLQDLKKIDFQPLSTSESAIDRMQPQTDTDSSTSQFLSPSHSSTFPRRTRNRAFQRAFSSCEQTSPRATKRKLKYSSSSSATDSQTSRSSTTKMAASTEEEDNSRTLMYSSIEQMRFQGTASSLTESESETTDDYLTAPMDEVMTSADEDPHNSTGSFSENAWDPYQMMYPTASEDATEEVLHWEPVDDMEFDDEFQLKGSSILKDAIGRRAAKDKLKLKPMRSPGACEDSDSDMEDFRSVLEDSEMCLKVVDHSLKKKRHNPMGTGLAKSGKYAEMVATCETNISCVKNVCQHLTSEDIGMNDVQRVQDLLHQWEKLHELATERHQQAQQLSATSDAIKDMKKTLEGACQCLMYDSFSSKEELEATITELRVKQQKLEEQRCAIRDQQGALHDFLRHYPSINITKYQEEFAVLETSTLQAQDKVSSQLGELENNWAVWCEYLEGKQELDMWMAADRDRLYAMLCQREAGQLLTKKDVLKELETLQNNLSMYETKLAVLQAMHNRLTHCSSDDAQRTMLASIADLRNQLLTVSDRCRQMYRDMEEDEALPVDDTQFGRLAMSAATVHESYKNSRTLEQLNKFDSTAAANTGSYGTSRLACSSAWSWLRSVPVQIVALMMVAGLVYVLDPDILSGLANFSVTISPELRHVNGPPPL
ncbi:hypothetical protein BaRGS_00001944 [Batillaria attramentaria]|uniref:KASH domain-containing protein n=1 Tax=Batillaria attramentaria TaxID=370345 RepID=A0ABD0M7E0_9CAEN